MIRLTIWRSSQIWGVLLAALAMVTPSMGLANPSVDRETRNDDVHCEWAPGFGLQGFNGPVYATIEFDDGTGSALYVAGSFTAVETLAVDRIAKWNGTFWAPVGAGFNATVRTLAVFDDGNGAALYAGGDFTASGRSSVEYAARWDGASWIPLADGLDGRVYSLHVHDDGAAVALYAGGRFSRAGLVEARTVAKWDGSSWSSLGTRLSGTANSLSTFDDGSGPKLYAGGTFSLGLDFESVVAWDGRFWEPVGLLESLFNVEVLLAADIGNGPELFAGGDRLTQSSSLASWDPAARTWRSLASGVEMLVTALVAFDDGDGTALYIGGAIEHSSGGVAAVARWKDGRVSVPYASFEPIVYTMAVHDDGSGPSLLVGGDFAVPALAGQVVSGLARWRKDLFHWQAVGPAEGNANGLDGTVSSLLVHDDGSGPALFAAGDFKHAGGLPVLRIARWDGQAWSRLDTGVDDYVRVLARFDDGSGAQLVAAGSFSRAGDVSASHIATWDGARWHPLGSGLNRTVTDLQVFDDGSGPALYVSGYFSQAGGLGIENLARWDGRGWSQVGEGLGDDVADLVVFDDGAGPALYALMDYFDQPGPYPLNRLAKWDGSSWTEIDLEDISDRVEGLAVLDDSLLSGTAGFSLYAKLRDEEGPLARWDGSSWQVLRDVRGGFDTFEVFDDGFGPRLFAGGYFGQSSDYGSLATRDEDAWRIHRSLEGGVYDLVVFDDGTGAALFVAGTVRQAGGTFSSRIAKYVCSEQ